MFLAYVDESYTKHRYYMAALLVPDRIANSLSKALDQLVEKASKSYGVEVDAELHGHDLFQAKTGKSWPHRCGPGSASTMTHSAPSEATTSRSSYVVSTWRALRKLTTDTAQTVVLGHLLERINECAERHDDYSLVIADEVDEPAKHRSDLRTYRLAGTRGHLPSQLSRIVDTLHFAPSTASRLVQAADLIAFLHRRIELHGIGDERAIRANRALWARIAARVVHSHCWVPDGENETTMHEGPAPSGA